MSEALTLHANFKGQLPPSNLDKEYFLKIKINAKISDEQNISILNQDQSDRVGFRVSEVHELCPHRVGPVIYIFDICSSGIVLN